MNADALEYLSMDHTYCKCGRFFNCRHLEMHFSHLHLNLSTNVEIRANATKGILFFQNQSGPDHEKNLYHFPFSVISSNNSELLLLLLLKKKNILRYY